MGFLTLLKEHTKSNMSPYSPSYMDSANLFLSRLAMAETTEDIQKALEGMEETAQKIPAAKTILGLAYLLEGKPWYDFKRGFQAISEAAEGDEPFCWFILGSLYLNGRAEIKKDPILAKYWIKKAADKGFQDAAKFYNLEWGDNPEGFKEYVMSGEGLRDLRRIKYIRWALIGLASIGVIILVLLGLGVL